MNRLSEDEFNARVQQHQLFLAFSSSKYSQRDGVNLTLVKYFQRFHPEATAPAYSFSPAQSGKWLCKLVVDTKVHIWGSGRFGGPETMTFRSEANDSVTAMNSCTKQATDGIEARLTLVRTSTDDEMGTCAMFLVTAGASAFLMLAIFVTVQISVMAGEWT